MVTLRGSTKKITLDEALLKCIFFILMIVPTSPKIFNVNVYRFVGIAVFLLVQCIVVYGLLGLTLPENEIDLNSKCQIIFVLSFNVLILVMLLFTLLGKSDEMLDLSRMMHVDYFTDTKYSKYVCIFHEYRNLSIKMGYALYLFMAVCLISWFIFPILMNVQQRDMKSDHGYVRRYENVFNFQFPVTTDIYNNYYLLFYAMEIIMGFYLATMNMVYNIFFVMSSFALIGQYEVIKTAFEDVSHELLTIETVDGYKKNNYDTDDCYNDFKSILFDYQNLYQRFKSYYSVVWLYTQISCGLISGSIIIIVYILIVIITSVDSLSILNIFKFTTLAIILIFQLFLVCYFVEKVIDKKDSVKFGMYSCNWTMTNLKFKKLLLLSKMMHDANKLTLKITPKKIVNLQLFASVLTTSYNILSVMIKSRFNEVQAD